MFWLTVCSEQFQIDAVGWKCAFRHLSVSSADFSLKFENAVKNNDKMSFHNSTTDANCSRKGRATIYISVAITELFKINRCFVFLFLYIFNIPRKSLFRFRRKQHWLQFSIMYLPNQQFILFHIGGENRRNVTCLAILFLNKLGGLLRLIHRVGVRILSPKFPLFRTAPLFHVNCTTK